MIIEESKDRYIRVLEYKYMKVCMQMEVRIITVLYFNMIDANPKSTFRGADRLRDAQKGRECR